MRGREEDLHEGSSVSQGLQDDPEENRDPNVGKGQSDGGGQDDSHEIGIHREEALRSQSQRKNEEEKRARGREADLAEGGTDGAPAPDSPQKIDKLQESDDINSAEERRETKGRMVRGKEVVGGQVQTGKG